MAAQSELKMKVAISNTLIPLNSASESAMWMSFCITYCFYERGFLTGGDSFLCAFFARITVVQGLMFFYGEKLRVLIRVNTAIVSSWDNGKTHR